MDLPDPLPAKCVRSRPRWLRLLVSGASPARTSLAATAIQQVLVHGRRDGLFSPAAVLGEAK
jgi:hypothetical protein